MARDELTREQLLELIGKRLEGGAPISAAKIVRDYQVSRDYSERLAKMLDTLVTQISGNEVPPVTEPFPKTLEEGLRSALGENAEKALHYHLQITKRFTWGRLMMLRETSFVDKMLKQFQVQQQDRILDVPCGTGILSSVFLNFDVKVFCGDISMAMMKIAQQEYKNNRVSGFFQGDITNLPFGNDAFQFVIVLGLVQLLPRIVRQKALQEIFRISRRYIIISDSVDDYIQNLKRKIILRINPDQKFAPNPIKLTELYGEFNTLNLRIRKTMTVCSVFSSERIFLLEKRYK